MPTILQTAQGQVTGLWGAALIRGADGKMRALKIGDIVNRGDVILTTQDGIVRLAPAPEADVAVLPPSDEIDRVITGLNTDDPTAATAAVLPGDGGGELGPGLRVDRIVEALGARTSLPGGAERVLPRDIAFSNQIGATDRGTDEPANPPPPLATGSTSISATEEGPAVNLGLTQPAGVPATAPVTIDQVPAIGVLQMADGTVLTAGMVVTAADLAGLRYVPPADYNGTDPVGSFTYTLSSGGASATGSTSIGLAAVNDAPSATAATAQGLEDSTLPISLAGTDIDGTVTAVTVTGIPAGGTLLLADGVTPVLVGQALTPSQAAGLLFRPSADFNGSTGISFTVTDDGGAVSAVATVAIVVTAVNDMPVAAPDAATTSEDNAVNGNVLANDTDVDGPALSVTQFSVGGTAFAAGSTAALPGVGTLVIHPNGDYTFTPAPDYDGAVPVTTYTVSDGSLASTGTLTIGITPADDVPVAVADAFIAIEDQPFFGSVAGNDGLSGDGGNVFARVGGSGPSNGSIVFNNDGTFTYTPNANYHGADEFSYSITDADGDVSTATVTINVASVNEVPTAVADTVAATEDTPFVGSVAGNDTTSGDGGNVFALVGGSGPSNGGIVFNTDGTFTYTPNANYNGADAFSYSITDADGDVSTATVTINVASVNDVPTAVADTVAATEDTPFVGSVAGNDTPSGDGGNVFALVGGSGPSNGGIVFNNDGTFTYTPNANYHGADEFSYSITDADGDVSTATMTINVASVNDVPTAVADTIAATEDTPFVGSVAGNDTLSGDGGNVFALVGGSGPTNGGIVFNNDGTFTYTPSANYNGADEFSYSITDADGDVSTATVTISVASVNDVPTAVADTVAATEDTPFVGSVAGNDTPSGDGGNVFALVGGSGPSNGGIVFNNDGTFTYTPNANYHGTDEFSYSITDADGDVSTATVTINVASVNDVPTAVADTVAATEDTPFVGSVAGNDTPSGDGGNVFALVGGSGPSNGGIVFNTDGTFTYTPNANYHGADEFSYSITDADGDVSTATVTINVASVNDVPTAVADTVAATEDTPFVGSVAGNDSLSGDGGNVFALVGGSGPTNGGIVFNNDGTFTYTPNANYHGADEFSYSITDADGDVSTATVTINVASINDIPTAVADTVAATEDTPFVGSVAGNDTLSGDGGNVFALVGGSGPSNGGIVFNNDGTFTYTPNANYHGADEFSYSITDADGDVSTATVTISVASVNDVPTAVADTVAATEDTPFVGSVAGNDTPSGDGGNVFALVGGSGPSNGGIVFNNDGTFTYTPNANYHGADEFSYSITDTDGDISTATVTINVASVNDVPTAVADTVAATEDTPFVGSVAGNDSLSGDGGNVFALVGGSGPSNGGIVFTTDGTFTYTPNANYNGPDEFTYSITDANGDVSTATVTINVTSVNDAPTGADRSVTILEDSTYTLSQADFGFSDTSDSPADGFAAVTLNPPSAGTLSFDGVAVTATLTVTAADLDAGRVTFRPAVHSNGPLYASLSFTVQDDGGTSDGGVDTDSTPHTLVFSVTAVNDAPVNRMPGAASGITVFEDTPIAITGLSVADPDESTGPASHQLASVNLAVRNGTLEVTLAAGTTITFGSNGSGTLTLSGDQASINATLATLQYQGNANYSGTDTLVVTSRDGLGLADADSVPIFVLPVNDAPVAANDGASTPINTAVTIEVKANDADPDNTGAQLVVSNVTLGDPSHGSVTLNPDGTITFTPATDFTGAASIGYTLTDPGGLSDTALVTVTVGPNTPPAGADFALTTAEDTPVVVGIADFGFSDADAGQSFIAVRIETLPAAGSLLLNGAAVAAGDVVSAAQIAAGELSFVPSANENGSDYASFTFSVQDSFGGFDATPNTATFHVTAVNDVPVAVADTVSAIEDQVFIGTVAGNDAVSGDGGNVFALVGGSGPSNGGIVFNTDGTFTYTPNANYHGADEFSYSITDADGDVSTTTVTINIASVNDVPTAVADSVAAIEDTPFVGSVAGNDTPSGDGGNVFALIGGSGPSDGGIVFNTDGTFTYTPNANYHGADEFSYSITDADGDVSTTTVTISVASVNDVPTAVADTVAATEDTPFVGSVAGNDTLSGDGGNVFALVGGSGPSNGGIVFNNDGTFTYTPNANYHGADEFSYSITDADGDVSTATVTINVASVNDVPTAVADTVAATEDTPFVGSVAGNDTPSGDGGNVFALVGGSGPSNGGIVFNNDGTFTYTPNANYHGADEFSYSITDADGNVSTATVTINVASVNDVPTAVADTIAATEDTPFVGSVAGNDSPSGDGGNVFALVSGSGPTNGGIVFNTDGTFTYTPNANYHGPDEFSYSTTDADGDVSTATVAITVAAINDAPVAAADVATIGEDGMATGNVLANDMDHEGDAVTVSGFDVAGIAGTFAAGSTASIPGVGTLQIDANGDFSFTPVADYSGTVPTATYTVSDGTATSAATLSISVTPIADQPTLAAWTTQWVDANEDWSDNDVATGQMVWTGSDADAVEVRTQNTYNNVQNPNTAATPATNLVAELEGDADAANWIQTTIQAPLAGQVMQIEFDTIRRNASGGSDRDTQSFDVLWNGVVVGSFNPSASAWSTPVLQVTSQAGENTLRFRPTDQTGSFGALIDNLSVKTIADGSENTVVQLPSLAGAAAFGDMADNSEQHTLRIGSIPEGATLSDGTRSFTASAGNTAVTIYDEDDPSAVPGGANWNLATLTLSPPNNFNGTLSLTVTASAVESANGSTATTQSTLVLVIRGVNNAPSAGDDTISVSEDDVLATTAITGVLSNDVDPEGGVLFVSAVGGAAAAVGATIAGSHGTIQIEADGAYVYTPGAAAQSLGAGQTLSDTFSYTVTDSGGLTSNASLTVTIQGANDAPLAAGDAAALGENGTLSVAAAAGVLANDTDVDAADVLTVSGVSFGATTGVVGSALVGTFGTLTLNADGSYSYLANRPASDALAAGQTAVEVFDYTTSDVAGSTSSATIAFTITGTNDAPVVQADSGTTLEDTPISGNVLSNDSDVDSASLAVTQFVVGGTTFAAGSTATLAGVGVLLLQADGSYTFTPATHYAGAVPAITYTVSDGSGGTATGALSISVTAAADAPVVIAPSQLQALVAGTSSISTTAAINQNSLADAIGFPRASLDSFAPPSGPGTNHPGTVNVNDGAITNYSYGLPSGATARFSWSFTNGEDLASEINSGFNDIVAVIITAPDGTQTSQLITSSEQAGVATNASGVFSFTALTAGNYQFSWLVMNGSDTGKDSSLAINDIEFQQGGFTYGAAVAFPLIAGLADRDGSETLSVTVSGVPATAAFSAGTSLGGGVWSFTASELPGLTFLTADGFTGTVNLTVSATATETSNGSTATTTQAVAITVAETSTVLTGTHANNTLTGTGANDHLQGLSGNDTLSGGAGHDLVHGGTGDDTLNGNDGNDVLNGGLGNDTLAGGNGNDILIGGAGSDQLTGGAGSDVFRWEFGDAGATGSGPTDTVLDFSLASPSAGGDVLDLRDLLQGESTAGGDAGNLVNYLHFTVSGGTTTIQISSTGGFSGGFSSGAVDQTIVLQGADLSAANTFTTDQQIIQDLLGKAKLIVDGGP